MAGYGDGTFSRNNFREIYKKKLPSAPPYTAFIGNLPSDIIQSDIDNMFRDLKVESVKLIRDSDTGEYNGYCYVEFDDIKCLEEALKYDGTLFHDKCVRVTISVSISNSPNLAKRLADLEEEIASIKRLTDLEEEIASIKQENVGYEIKAAADAENVAKMERKLADDSEKDGRKFEKEDSLLYGRLEDSPNTAERLADTVEKISLYKTPGIEDAIRRAADAENVTKIQRKLADDLEKCRKKFEKEYYLPYGMLKDSLDVSKLSAVIAEKISLYKTRAIEEAKKMAETQANMLLVQNELDTRRNF